MSAAAPGWRRPTLSRLALELLLDGLLGLLVLLRVAFWAALLAGFLWAMHGSWGRSWVELARVGRRVALWVFGA